LFVVSVEFVAAAGPRQIWSTVDRLLDLSWHICESVDATLLPKFNTSARLLPAQQHHCIRHFRMALTCLHSAESLLLSLIYRTSRLPLIRIRLASCGVADILYSLLVYLFNLSLDCGQSLSCFKSAFLTPVLNKPGLPASQSSSYQPISNLSIISKRLERLVAKQLMSFLLAN
jgi:hypothetical protein